MADEHREQQFERALTRLLRDVSPDARCPDPETLAAYHENNLSAQQMHELKEHIAGCAPCQEILALVEQSKDVSAEEWQGEQLSLPAFDKRPPIPLRTAASGLPAHRESATPPVRATSHLRDVRSRLRWRWIAPVGAVAAAAIVWVGFREARRAHENTPQAVQMARNVAVEPALISPKTGAYAKYSGTARREEQNSTAALKKSVPAPAGQSETGVLRDRRVAVPPASEPALPSPSAAERAPRMKARAQNAPAAAYANAPASAPAPVAPPAAVEGGAAAKEASAPTLQSAEEATRVDALEEKLPSGANLLDVAAADHRYILAPGGKTAWRVGEVGKIEHSTNRGKNWKIEVSGVSVDLTAGSATSDKVAWVIGKSGMVLRSTDGGKHWRQITSPISGDLGGIHATDAQSATIWDVANRASFETSDGGATWTPVGKP
jgi:hypothetical protein